MSCLPRHLEHKPVLYQPNTRQGVNVKSFFKKFAVVHYVDERNSKACHVRDCVVMR